MEIERNNSSYYFKLNIDMKTTATNKQTNQKVYVSLFVYIIIRYKRVATEKEAKKWHTNRNRNERTNQYIRVCVCSGGQDFSFMFHFFAVRFWFCSFSSFLRYCGFAFSIHQMNIYRVACVCVRLQQYEPIRESVLMNFFFVNLWRPTDPFLTAFGRPPAIN